MMDKNYFLSVYDSLPEGAKKAISELYDTGVNNSGVWVRFGNVEATIGKIIFSLKHDADSRKGSEEQSGEWEHWDSPFCGNPYGHYVCSNCAQKVPHKTKYCENCGATMQNFYDNEH